MAIPSSAVAISQTMDPSDQIDILIPCGPLLESGETVASYTLTVLAESAALGFEIMSGGGRDHALLTGDTDILAWIEIDDLEEAATEWDGDGTACAIEVEIVTDSTPARTRQRTITITVKQR